MTHRVAADTELRPDLAKLGRSYWSQKSALAGPLGHSDNAATMPELPEVETVRRGLEPVLVGQRFVSIDLRRPALRFPFPPDFCSRLHDIEVTGLRRRAKFLIADLRSGDCLVMHLGMTGRFTINAKRVQNASTPGDYIYQLDANPKHDHVVFDLTGGHRVTYNDPRRFGFMQIVPAGALQQHPFFSHLGVEPLGNHLSAEYLAKQAQGARRSLKAFLMDQRVVAGLGNIYVCESLHLAGLSPNRLAASMADKQGLATVRAERLATAIRGVLQKAVDLGGSTLRDYRHPSGDSGGFQETFAVYDRAGEMCVRPACGGTIKRIIQQGRSTFYCGQCQR